MKYKKVTHDIYQENTLLFLFSVIAIMDDALITAAPEIPSKESANWLKSSVY